MGQSQPFSKSRVGRSEAFMQAVLEGAEMLERGEVRALADRLHVLARRMGEPHLGEHTPRDDGRSIWL